jgi:hypothetical protein
MPQDPKSRRPDDAQQERNKRIDKASRDIDRRIDETVREDRQVIRDELPPVLPADADKDD